MIVPHNNRHVLRFRINFRILLFVFLLFATILSVSLLAWLSQRRYNLQKEIIETESASWINRLWLYQHEVARIQENLARLDQRGHDLYGQIWNDLPADSFDFLSNPGLAEEFNGKTRPLGASIGFILTREIAYRDIPLGWPISNGRVTSPFGSRLSPFGYSKDFHTGTDFAFAPGTPIYATADGTVIYAGSNGTGYGYHVRILHKYGFVTLYGHCMSVNVRLNQQVKRGDLIAHLGMTGSATGPHVHYEIRLKKDDDIYPYEVFLNPWPFARESL